MQKEYFVVDRKTNKIITTKQVGAAKQVLYENSPKLRKGNRLILASFACGVLMLLFAFIGYFFASLRSVVWPCATVSACADFILTCTGAILERNAKRLGVSGDISNKAKCKGIPWFDPYGLARDAADVPGKKTYYIVDAERSAVVDVIRLGKWGQKRLERRAKRQAERESK